MDLLSHWSHNPGITAVLGYTLGIFCGGVIMWLRPRAVREHYTVIRDSDMRQFVANRRRAECHPAYQDGLQEAVTS